MRRVAGLALACGFLLGAGAEAGPEDFVTIQELSDADLARIDLEDGSVADWLEMLGEPTLRAADFMADEGYVRYDPSDLDFRVWLGWHASGRIYCAVERVDDVYVNEFPDPRLQFKCGVDSCVELLLDGDHSGGMFTAYHPGDCERERLESNQQAQHYQALGDPQAGRRPVNLSESCLYQEPRWYLEPPYAAGGGGRYGESPTFYVTEFYVTAFDHFVWNDAAASRVSDLRAGTVIGLNLVIADYDIPRTSPPHYNFPRDSRHAFGYGGIDIDSRGSDSGMWADALLLGKGESPVSGAGEVVRLTPEMWAQLKLGVLR